MRNDNVAVLSSSGDMTSFFVRRYHHTFQDLEELSAVYEGEEVVVRYDR